VNGASRDDGVGLEKHGREKIREIVIDLTGRMFEASAAGIAGRDPVMDQLDEFTARHGSDEVQ